MEYFEFFKTGGISALIFIVWMVYHRAQRQADKDTYTSNMELLKQIIEDQNKREKQNFDLLKEMIEQSNYQSAAMARIEQKMDSQNWCPIVRERSTK